ncbi:MAG: hypothetical protein COT24_03730 [Candidatus Kerfeldbacteria bacterium CG08_land_8_20_14_0_20_40_16]|uniref:ABC transporter substrate-binding protein n=1 Tax=Candidatus Kerfeldbacteria bacterium CG08_land_8_20_14_0_20_40_16 TaxID=2014244 RepID=A0A2H0YV85_9BACT|nr:MAG: hypothetical protein COT24_03730 [Candidatus Kerfeldbacteria bacterium CG08_land_8_20_14_0_20_40_16]
MSKKILFILGPIALIAIGLILYSLIGGGETKIPADATKPKKLVYWGVFNEGGDLTDIINSYKATHPNITIEYRKLRPEEYEQALLEAWAKDEGPDIFSIHNNWVGKYQDFIAPLPSSTKMAYYSKTKTLGIKEETKIEYKETPSLKLTDLQNNFVEVVYQDAVADGKIYGLPLSMDTLALFYNRDLLNQAKIPLPPTNYDEFLSDVSKLTVLDREGNVVQAGAALGTANNIPRATDILFLFMLQSRTEMIDSSGKKVNFTHNSPEDPSKYPGVLALDFFTQFADKNKEVYTWNEDLPDALELFTQGKLAFFFAYSYQIPIIEQQGQGKLNYGITNIPELNQEVNYANYWLETISKKTPYTNEAWDFIQFATKAENVTKYLNKTNKPTVLKALIPQQAEDSQLQYFVLSSLVAKSWYHGKDPNLMEQYINDLIDNVVKGKLETKEALQLAQKLIQQTY